MDQTLQQKEEARMMKKVQRAHQNQVPCPATTAKEKEVRHSLGRKNFQGKVP